MTRCEDCKHHSELPDSGHFVRCNFKLPDWVATWDDHLAGNFMVMRNSSCSFGEPETNYAEAK